MNKRFPLMVGASLLVMATVADSTNVAEKRPLKVLMIGNSFSASVMRETPKLAAASGFVLDIAQAGIGGCPLDKHWTNVVKSTDAELRPYGFHYSYETRHSVSRSLG